MNITRLLITPLLALSLSACNTMTGVGKDLQEMGKKMDPQAKPSQTAPNGSSAPTTNPNKDVTITPVK